jgi:hypothetical protein
VSKGTPLRNVRVPDDVWEAARKRAEIYGYGSVSGFVQAALVKLASYEGSTGGTPGRIVVTPPRKAATDE